MVLEIFIAGLPSGVLVSARFCHSKPTCIPYCFAAAACLSLRMFSGNFELYNPLFLEFQDLLVLTPTQLKSE